MLSHLMCITISGHTVVATTTEKRLVSVFFFLYCLLRIKRKTKNPAVYAMHGFAFVRAYFQVSLAYMSLNSFESVKLKMRHAHIEIRTHSDTQTHIKCLAYSVYSKQKFP